MDQLLQKNTIYKNTKTNEILVFNENNIKEAINTRDLFEFSPLFGKHFPVEDRELLTQNEFLDKEFFIFENGKGYQVANWDELNKDLIYTIWNGTEQKKYLLESTKENTPFEKINIKINDVLDEYDHQRERGHNNRFYYVQINNDNLDENAILRGTSEHFEDTVPNLLKLNSEEKKEISAHGLEKFVKNHLI